MPDENSLLGVKFDHLDSSRELHSYTESSWAQCLAIRAPHEDDHVIESGTAHFLLFTPDLKLRLVTINFEGGTYSARESDDLTYVNSFVPESLDAFAHILLDDNYVFFGKTNTYFLPETELEKHVGFVMMTSSIKRNSGGILENYD